MEVEAAVNAAMSVFSRKGNNTELIAAAANAAQAASATIRKKRDLPVKLQPSMARVRSLG